MILFTNSTVMYFRDRSILVDSGTVISNRDHGGTYLRSGRNPDMFRPDSFSETVLGSAFCKCIFTSTYHILTRISQKSKLL